MKAAAAIPSDLSPSAVCAIIGKRGTGKSTAGKLLASKLLARGRRVLAFDPHDEWSQAGAASRQVILGDLRERITADDLARHPERLDDPGLSLAVVPRRSPADCAADFALVSELAQATGDLALFVEEVGLIFEHASSALVELATQSRHASMPLCLLAQRAVQIPATARAQVSVLLSFLQTHPADLEALEDLTGDPEFPERVRVLGRGECELWQDVIGTPTSGRKEKR